MKNFDVEGLEQKPELSENTKEAAFHFRKSLEIDEEFLNSEKVLERINGSEDLKKYQEQALAEIERTKKQLDSLETNPGWASVTLEGVTGKMEFIEGRVSHIRSFVKEEKE